jgi:predicted anti-sigma-YlaC factor YlaD
MSEVEMNCMEAREKHAEAHIKTCGSCSLWSQQVGDIVSMTSSMPQFDVSEALTQNIMKAVESEPAHQPSVLSGANLFQVLFGLAVVAVMLVESAEDFNGLVAWAIGIGVLYSINLLVKSNQEAEILCE